MSPREALLREMLAAAKDRLVTEGWSREADERAKGFLLAIDVVDEWAKMSDAPQAVEREAYVLGDSPCAETAAQ